MVNSEWKPAACQLSLSDECVFYFIYFQKKYNDNSEGLKKNRITMEVE